MAPVPEIPISPRAMKPELELEPLAGKIASLVIGLTTICVFSSLLTQRVLAIKEWRSLSFVIWIVLLLYISSLLFVFTSLIFQYGFGPIENLSLCSASSLICLSGYLATKALTYLFLVDRAHICRGTTKSRLKSKLYLWNACGMLSIFAVIGILGFVYRTYLIDDHGRCKIGVETKILIPLLIYDAVANIYLTILFLRPLMSTYSVQWKFWKSGSKVWNMGSPGAHAPNPQLRKLAQRTLVGGVGTTIITLVNLFVLNILKGEVAWLCLLCCICDIFFSVLLIHWVTIPDHSSSPNTRPSLGSSNSTLTPDKPGDWPLSPSLSKNYQIEDFDPVK